MALTWTKLFSNLPKSTIWRASKEAKILWVTMLALKDKDGIVDGTIPGLAKEADLTLEETEAALVYLMSPDKYSRTKDNEGRRVKEIEGGWVILNHFLYRDEMEKRREYQARKQREYRARKMEQQKSRPLPGDAAVQRAIKAGATVEQTNAMTDACLPDDKQ
jgi:hypothetical protein